MGLEVMELTLVSPHRDDAAFSCGILLSLCARIGLKVRILNVFTYSDYAPFARSSSAGQISDLRKGEDARLRRLAGTFLHFCDLGLLDAPLRFQIPPEETLKHPIGRFDYLKDVKDVQKVLRPILEGEDCIVLPMAIGGHIDHRVVRDAIIEFVPRRALAFYEDLPYAARISADERAGVIAELDPLDQLRSITIRLSEGLAIKKAFASCYSSQIAPSTVAEIVAYGEDLGGCEHLYAGEDAGRFLRRLVRLGNESARKT